MVKCWNVILWTFSVHVVWKFIFNYKVSYSVTVNIKGTCIYISATDFRGFKETKYHCNVEKLCNKYFKQFKWAKYIKQAMIKLLKCSFAVLLWHNFASNSFKIIWYTLPSSRFPKFLLHLGTNLPECLNANYSHPLPQATRLFTHKQETISPEISDSLDM